MAKKLIFFFMILFVGLVSGSSFGYNNPQIPKITNNGEKIDCSLITGGSDSDFCSDSTSGGVGISWSEATNGTLYLSSNPSNFISWANAINGTLLDITTLLGFNYWNLTYYGGIGNWSEDKGNYSNWENQTSTFYLASNPDGFVSNSTMNKSVSCEDIFGDDADFCVDDGEGVGNWSEDKGNYSTWSNQTSSFATIDEPLWTDNFTKYNGTWSEGISWAEVTNSTVVELSTLLSFGYYNLTDFDINDYLLVSQWNSTNTSYYLETNPYGFFNSSNTKFPMTTTLDIYPNNQQTIGLRISNNTQNYTMQLLGSSVLQILDDLWIPSNNISTGAYFVGDGRYLTNLPAGTESDPIWDADKTNYSTWDNQTSTFILQSEEPNLNVNSSDWWDSYDSTNSTQFESNDGVLTVISDWFVNKFNAIFGTKTTDDLTQGSTNLYDNQSWNHSAYWTNASNTFLQSAESDPVWTNEKGNYSTYSNDTSTFLLKSEWNATNTTYRTLTNNSFTHDLNVTAGNITIDSNKYVYLSADQNSYFKTNSTTTVWMLNETGGQRIISNGSGLYLYGGT